MLQIQELMIEVVWGKSEMDVVTTAGVVALLRG